MSILILQSIHELRQHVSKVKKSGQQVALVPTMGALHAGHMELVNQAILTKAHVIVSIFVNPLQFAAGEDLSKYPRTFEADRAKLFEAGANAIYTPDAYEMYPEDFDLSLMPGGVAKVGLEDAFRPTHFQGVATVVAKLFAQSAADCAFFGEKDYQQLKVIIRMVNDLNLPIEIFSIATMREPDGLAMSSRNAYLSAENRAKAPLIYSVLNQTVQAIKAGEQIEAALANGHRLLSEAGFKIDYYEARNADNLKEIVDRDKEKIRLLIAAKIGATRLIDNMGL